jgi:ABC-type transporter Mla subunit MlaD
VSPTPADPRIWGRKYTGAGPVPLGILMVVILAVLCWLAFTKDNPFSGPGYTVKATFENASTLRTTSPVRIAGVKVVSEEGRPLHTDATIEIRPRLFLEGNLFLDVRPGSPSAPEIEEGGTIPMTQTATAVQLDEVLAALNTDTRVNLRRLLEGYGTALTYEPTAADDADQDPDSAGKTAAEALQASLRYGGPAGRDSAIVQEALLGEQPHDLSALIRAQRDLFKRLEGHETQLQGLISNFNTTAGALAAEQSNLSASIRELAPTL